MSTALHDAVERHDLQGLRTLLEGGADPDVCAPESPQWSALNAAIEELAEGGPLQAVELLLAHGAAINGADGPRDFTPLMLAILTRQPPAARLLLAAGADPNVVGAEGDSALRLAVEQDDRDLAALLLSHGADRTIDGAGGPSGMNALGRAASRLNIEMIRLLLEAGARPEALDADYRTAYERLPPRAAADGAAWDAAAALLARGRRFPA